MEIRKLEKEDADIIDFITTRLASEWVSSKEAIYQKYIELSFHGGFPYIYVAHTPEGQFVGYVFVVMEEKGYMDINNQPWGSSLFVKEEFRGQGIAQKMIQVTEDKCKSLGFPYIYLDTASAAPYYRRLGGWEEIGEAFWERGQKTVTIFRKKL